MNLEFSCEETGNRLMRPGRVTVHGERSAEHQGLISRCFSLARFPYRSIFIERVSLHSRDVSSKLYHSIPSIQVLIFVSHLYLTFRSYLGLSSFIKRIVFFLPSLFPQFLIFADVLAKLTRLPDYVFVARRVSRRIG